MSKKRPYVGARGRGNTPSASRRERAAQNRSERARAHLERVREGVAPPQVPNLVMAAPIAIVASLIAGGLFGSPLVAAARTWIAGEPIRLESISVSGAERLSLSEVGRATDLPKGISIADIVPDEVESQLLTHPWISDAAVVRLPASKLLIAITERVARAVVAIPSPPESEQHQQQYQQQHHQHQQQPKQWRVVSTNGLPFADASGTDIESLPKLIVQSAPAAGQPNKALADAIELAARFSAFDLPTPTEIWVDEGSGSEGWAIRLSSLAPRVILGRDDVDDRLAALAKLLRAGRTELAEAQTIDLRFAEQAVLRSTPSPEGTAQAASTRNNVSMPKPRPTG